MREALLSAQGVSVRFGGLVAVDGVDLDVHGGELVGVIGPNGAGKTTFFHTLSGVLVPTEGSVVVAGDGFSRWSGRSGVLMDWLGPLVVVRVPNRRMLHRWILDIRLGPMSATRSQAKCS